MKERFVAVPLAAATALGGVGAVEPQQESQSIVEQFKAPLELAQMIEGVDKWVRLEAEPNFFIPLVERANAPDNYKHFKVDRPFPGRTEYRYFDDEITEDTVMSDSKIFYGHEVQVMPDAITKTDLFVTDEFTILLFSRHNTLEGERGNKIIPKVVYDNYFDNVSQETWEAPAVEQMLPNGVVVLLKTHVFQDGDEEMIMVSTDSQIGFSNTDFEHTRNANGDEPVSQEVEVELFNNLEQFREDEQARKLAKQEKGGGE